MNKNQEMMKKLLEEKKKKIADSNVERPGKKIGHTQKAFINKKTGGSLNK